MRLSLRILLATALLAAPFPAPAQTLADAREAARAGEYAKAASALRRLVRADPTDAPTRRELVRVLLVVGEYSEAERAARSAPDPLPLANALGETLVLRGRLDEAESSFRLATGEATSPSSGSTPAAQPVSTRAPDQLTASVNLAELLFTTGRIDEAMARFDRFIDVYNTRVGGLSAPELVAVGRAVERLGRNDPGLFQDALRAYDEARATDPGWAEPSIRAGNLFLDKYQSPEAQAELEAVTRVNPRNPEALLGLARAMLFDRQGDARGTLDELLEVNPNHVGGRTLLAMLHLQRGHYGEAHAEAERALAVNPSSLEGLTALAAAHFVQGEDEAFSSVRARALALNPRYASLDTEIANILVRERRYREASHRAEVAIALDPFAWEAHGVLGMNRMRLGDIDGGRASLETAFGGDPYNPWFKNSLDLLDTFDRFETHATEHLILFLHGSESELLSTYLVPLAEEAYDSLARRYGIEPALPVRAEFFPSHADFSVRTLGEAGLGALGVSFGPVLAMDSPGARERGDYNWASVFWHELAHTFHLAASNGRVPRWFSEGLAVHEQRKARPGWGHQASVTFLLALDGGGLKKFSELDDGFLRPANPGQVALSYYQASLVFQFIEDGYGFGPIRSMLRGYAEGRSTAELVEAALGKSMDEMDGEFDGYLRQRFHEALAGLASAPDPPPPGASLDELMEYAARSPANAVARLRLGTALANAERHAEARPHLEAALHSMPELGGSVSPHWPLARGHAAEGNADAAVHHLNELTRVWESGYEPLILLADLNEEAGQPEAVAKALDRAVLIWPYDIEVHRRLAVLHEELGSYASAVRERGAVVALDPPDRAEALYRLAAARHAAGDLEGARRDVIGALEIAPSFDEALELLLELRGGGGYPHHLPLPNRRP